MDTYHQEGETSKYCPAKEKFEETQEEIKRTVENEIEVLQKRHDHLNSIKES